MSLGEAITADRDRDLPRAASLYEEVLAAEPQLLEAMLNLMVLSWQVTDYGFWTGAGLKREFVDNSSRRLSRLFEQARALDRPEATFWVKYIEWCDLGGILSEEECSALLSKSESLDPALFLFSHSEGRRCVSEAEQLLRRSEADGTVKSEYIASVIKASKRQASERRGST